MLKSHRILAKKAGSNTRRSLSPSCYAWCAITTLVSRWLQQHSIFWYDI